MNKEIQVAEALLHLAEAADFQVVASAEARDKNKKSPKMDFTIFGLFGIISIKIQGYYSYCKDRRIYHS